MTHIWTFSPASEPYLQRCLSAALLQETDNKWTQKFGRKNTKIMKSEALVEKKPREIIEIAPSPTEQEDKNVNNVSYEDYFESIENEIRLDLIAEECSRNSDIILEMAKRLSANTVEKLFNHIFTVNNLEKSFLTVMFNQFLPAYLKLHYSWFCIDILTKTNEIYPELFQKLLKILLEDAEIPNQILNNYVATFDEEKSDNFMQNLTNIELSAENFKHNILMMYTVYKVCTKTDSIQNYIRRNLLQYGRSCASDRNYGRLFLTYLQTEKFLNHSINVKELKECLEVHISPFKRPCAILLKEFIQNE